MRLAELAFAILAAACAVGLGACGGGAAPVRCLGTAEPCADLGAFVRSAPDVPATCGVQLGCAAEEVPCAEGAYKSCDGIPEAACLDLGCTYSARNICTGTKLPCAGRTIAVCPTIGCSGGGYQCGGTAQPCSTLTTQDECGRQRGCAWF